MSIYKNYLNNAVLDTEQGEQNIYENAEKTLIESKKEKETNIINNFKESENSLKNLWKTNPVKAKEKESNLIRVSGFMILIETDLALFHFLSIVIEEYLFQNVFIRPLFFNNKINNVKYKI